MKVHGLLIALMLVLPAALFSQKLGNGFYWITLSDKFDNGYSVSQPEEYLSQRAIDRRERQNIEIKADDMPVSKVYTDSLQHLGLTIIGVSRWFNAVIAQSYDTLLLDSIGNLGFVDPFDPDLPRKRISHSIHTPLWEDVEYRFPKSFEFDYGLSFPQISLLNGHELHKAGFTGKGIQIALLDGGFYRVDSIAAFDSLRAENRLLGYKDFTSSGTDFFNSHYHGMSVLSTIAANEPGEIVGTAPHASVYLLLSEIIQSESPLEEALWVLAAEFADSAGADIITSSLGYSVFDDPSLNYSYSDMDGKSTLVTRAAEMAFSKGMIVVVSAGNEGNKEWKYITAPSDGENVICVGATDTGGFVAPFSSRGPSSDNRQKPDVVSVGSRTVITHSSGFTTYGYGTSYAAPQIAGLIACLWEANPDKSNKEITAAVRRSGNLYFNPNDSAGYGIPDFLAANLQLKSSVPSIQSEELSIIPNPNLGIFEIRHGNILTGDARVSIYDDSGKLIYNEIRNFDSGYTRIHELQGIKEGIYLVVVDRDKKKYSSNVLILKNENR